MRRSFAPLVLLALPLGASAQEIAPATVESRTPADATIGASNPDRTPACETVVTVEDAPQLDASWPTQVAQILKSEGFAPEGACLLFVDRPAPGAQADRAQTAKSGRLAPVCTSTREETTPCTYDFVAKPMALEGGGLVHIQIHGSDFNAARAAGPTSNGPTSNQGGGRSDR